MFKLYLLNGLNLKTLCNINLKKVEKMWGKNLPLCSGVFSCERCDKMILRDKKYIYIYTYIAHEVSISRRAAVFLLVLAGSIRQ